MKKIYIDVQAYAKKYSLTLEQAHEEIQPMLFDLNYDWQGINYHHKVSLVFADYLELNMDKEGRITQCPKETFEQSDYDQELVFNRTVNLAFEIRNKTEYIEFNGKQYDKRKLEQALKLIEEGK